MSRLDAWAIAIGLNISIALTGWYVGSNVHAQTALLQQIALQTKAPVAVRVSGFSPEAQQVFKKALEKGNKK